LRTIGTMPHAQIMKAIELYGTRVAPIVRRETAKIAPAEPVA
ncbi:MAG: LLM class flavin-dependent oxidoreductase, partial [Mesorhizobium sp.]